jgi:solute carrier family 26 (sodium-independent sulfate anion transporter), member 11
MEYIKSTPKRIKQAIVTDVTYQRTLRYGGKTIRALPSVTGQYLIEKVPVVYWLPKYNPRWILNDALAGITVGVLLIPQSLAYAKIATIPGEYGLMSSWLPNYLYFLMGTSKGGTIPASLYERC